MPRRPGGLVKGLFHFPLFRWCVDGAMVFNAVCFLSCHNILAELLKSITFHFSHIEIFDYGLYGVSVSSVVGLL